MFQQEHPAILWSLSHNKYETHSGNLTPRLLYTIFILVPSSKRRFKQKSIRLRAKLVVMYCVRYIGLVASNFLSFSSFSAVMHIKHTYISLRAAAPSASPLIPAIMIIAKFIERPFLINEQSRQSSKTSRSRDRGHCISRKTRYDRYIGQICIKSPSHHPSVQLCRQWHKKCSPEEEEKEEERQFFLMMLPLVNLPSLILSGWFLILAPRRKFWSESIWYHYW